MTTPDADPLAFAAVPVALLAAEVATPMGAGAELDSPERDPVSTPSPPFFDMVMPTPAPTPAPTTTNASKAAARRRRRRRVADSFFSDWRILGFSGAGYSALGAADRPGYEYRAGPSGGVASALSEAVANDFRDVFL